MDKSLYFDACAFAILVILLASLVLRGMTKGRLNKAFLALNVLILLTVVADICAVSLDNMGAGNINAKYIAHTLYLVLHSYVVPYYIYYIVIHTDTVHKFKKKIYNMCFVFLPPAVVTILLFVNPFNGFIFYIDEQGRYIRGAAFIVLYAVAAIGIIAGTVYLVQNRKSLSVRNFVALLAVYPFSIVAVALQYFSPNLLVEMFASACGMLLVSMIVQRPEELIEVNTGLNKLKAYVADMERAYYNEKPVLLLMIQLNNYEGLRDMLGYKDMNHVLRRISRQMNLLNQRCGLMAEVYYLENGKFQYVAEPKYIDKVKHVAECMKDFLKEGIRYRNMDINLVGSICIARCPEDLKDFKSLLSFVDDEIPDKYREEVIELSAIRRNDFYDVVKDIDEIVERAIANHNFAVYYQPIYSVKEDRFASAEALLRLNDDVYGPVSPAVFIPAAEKSGAICKIGDYVFEEVCKFIASEEFKQLKIDYIEINISVAQCMQSDLAKKLLQTMSKYCVDPKNINLEITETATTYSQKTFMDNLTALHNAGIKFALDDFGTGYSNMHRIASMPFRIIKIDRSLTKVEDNPKLMVVLKSAINMIKGMNMEVVVEGVETEYLVKLFKELECEYIQGFYYSKPIPKDEFVKYCMERR